MDEEGEQQAMPPIEITKEQIVEIKQDIELTPSLYRYRMDFKIYPFKCPCCKETITAPPNAVFMNPPFAVGVTKVAYGKKKKKRATKTQATLQGTESY